MRKISVLMLVLLATLAGCNADIASPFDKPDETTLPVQCQADGCAK